MEEISVRSADLCSITAPLGTTATPQGPGTLQFIEINIGGNLRRGEPQLNHMLDRTAAVQYSTDRRDVIPIDGCAHTGTGRSSPN